VTGAGLSPTDVRKAVTRHRALLAGALAAAAVASALGVLAPAAEPGVVVLTAAHDLPAGAELTAADMARTALPPTAVPAGAIVDGDEAVGRLLAAPVRRGEPLTDVRLAGARLLGPDQAGLMAVPVRLADAASAALLRAGDRVDVLAASSEPGGPAAARVVAAEATVLAVPTAVHDGAEGALIVLSASPAVAARLAAAAVSSRLSVALRGA
jgi:Flp pilus assembly protein CpaB